VIFQLEDLNSRGGVSEHQILQLNSTIERAEEVKKLERLAGVSLGFLQVHLPERSNQAIVHEIPLVDGRGSDQFLYDIFGVCVFLDQVPSRGLGFLREPCNWLKLHNFVT
jgi:hypothetical protein